MIKFFAIKVTWMVHVIVSLALAAVGCVYIAQVEYWPIPLWLIWIFSVSFVSFQQLKFSTLRILHPDEE